MNINSSDPDFDNACCHPTPLRSDMPEALSILQTVAGAQSTRLQENPGITGRKGEM